MMKSIIELPTKELVYRDLFFRVIMKTRNGKKLYLCEDSWYGKNAEKIKCKWEFSSVNALWFETEENAQDFCKEYFKNFDRYEIEDFIFTY